MKNHIKEKQLKRKLKDFNGADFIKEYNKYYFDFNSNKHPHLKKAFSDIGKQKGIDIKELHSLISKQKIKVNKNISIVIY